MYKNHILHKSDDLYRNITNKIELDRSLDKITLNIQAAYKESINVKKHITINHQTNYLAKGKHNLERKRNKLRKNDERNRTQHQIICNKINILMKEIKKISRDNNTRQQLNIIDKLNQAKEDNNLWKAANIFLNPPQKTTKN